MELSLPDMPIGVGGRRARSAAHPGEPCRQRRRRKLAADQRLARPSPAAQAIESAASASGNARKPDQGRRAHRRRDRSGRGPAEPAGARAASRICATAATLAALADNTMFGVLAPDLVTRRAAVPGEPLVISRRPAGAALHGAGQSSALSRRREPGDRERDRGQCRRRDFGRRARASPSFRAPPPSPAR